MIKLFFYWLKSEDNSYPLFIIKKILRWVAFNPLWERNIFKPIKKFFTSWEIVNYHIISKDPAVIIDIWQHRAFRRLDNYLPDPLKVHFFYLNWWHLESAEDVKTVKDEYTAHKKDYPQHEITYLCNSPVQYDLFNSFRLPCLLCNQNAFLDENMHKLIPDCPKEYDAIYIGVGVPTKRHYLAKEITSLALITYFAPFSKPKYIQTIKRDLSHAHWLIEPEPLKGFIPRTRMHHYLNKAKVGLCLSAAEGAMYASVEYLLCGLPVVTTKSMGGRDMFFDNEYVKIVEDHPSAVREGVDELIKRNIPGTYIRQKTIEKMQEHRKRFLTRLQEINVPLDTQHEKEAFWNNIFSNKMLSTRRIRYIHEDVLATRTREGRPNG